MGRRTTTGWLLCAALMIVLCQGQEDWMQCESTCKCKWVSGKKTAECTKQNLTQVPSDLSREIQNLDLTGNRFVNLTSNAFSRVHLVNLHKLTLRECGIESIDTDAFGGLKIIIEIDLSGNNIRRLQPGIFHETQRLRVFLLNQNRLRVLENDLFVNLTFLQRVSFSNNILDRIEERAFLNLPNLHSLALDGNNFSTLQLQRFEKLPKLGSLNLQNNPWNCNCHLRKLRDWAIENKLYTNPTTCLQPPNMTGKTWDEVDSEEFACRPKIIVIGPATKIEMGKGDVTLSCRATGIPSPKISWIHRGRVLSNNAKRPNNERGYILTSSNEWLNLTLVDVLSSDKGDYVCNAKNPGGDAERNVTLSVLGDALGKETIISLPLAIGLGVIALCLLIITLTLCMYYCRRRRTRHDEKSHEAASMEHQSLGEQEKSLITTINPVVKPPRRYEASSVTSHGTEMTELNRTLLDNDSVFADGVGSGVVGGVGGNIGDDEREHERTTPESDVGGGEGGGTLPRGGSGYHYRQYPPDLLAFSGGRGASPTSQASTVPDNSRVPYQHATAMTPVTTTTAGIPSYGSLPSAGGQYPAAFKTLPHSRSVTPYSLGPSSSSPLAPVLPRHGYVTIPRRPRAPSWSSGPPTSPIDRLEPVYDNLGRRTTADGSSELSLNKSAEPTSLSSMRGRPLPSMPSSHYGTIQRSTPNILTSSSLDRSAPEGAAEWPINLADESVEGGHALLAQQAGSNTLGRKVPPRPPPKPKKKSANGPLYEDEGEDGTEV